MAEHLVRRMVSVQKRMIHRSARAWVDAAERLQAGELSPSVWIAAYARYLDGLREDVAAGAGLASQPAEPPAAPSLPQRGRSAPSNRRPRSAAKRRPRGDE